VREDLAFAIKAGFGPPVWKQLARPCPGGVSNDEAATLAAQGRRKGPPSSRLSKSETWATPTSVLSGRRPVAVGCVRPVLPPITGLWWGSHRGRAARAVEEVALSRSIEVAQRPDDR